tara:strand:- start:834 stop:1034 length:201 start_codon:yes stop_codon:yes gene_type:complete
MKQINPEYTGTAGKAASARKLVMEVIGEISVNEKLTRFGHKAEVHDLNRKLARAVLAIDAIIKEQE